MTKADGSYGKEGTSSECNVTKRSVRSVPRPLLPPILSTHSLRSVCSLRFAHEWSEWACSVPLSFRSLPHAFASLQRVEVRESGASAKSDASLASLAPLGSIINFIILSHLSGATRSETKWNGVKRRARWVEARCAQFLHFPHLLSLLTVAKGMSKVGRHGEEISKSLIISSPCLPALRAGAKEWEWGEGGEWDEFFERGHGSLHP